MSKDTSETTIRKVIKLRNYSKKRGDDEKNVSEKEAPRVAHGNGRLQRGRTTTDIRKIPTIRRKEKSHVMTTRRRKREESPPRIAQQEENNQNRREIPQETNIPIPDQVADQTARTKAAKTPVVEVTPPDQTPPQKKIKLDQLYIDPKQITAYSTDLQRYLREKETLSRHRRIIRKFKRRRTIVHGPYTQIQSDTV